MLQLDQSSRRAVQRWSVLACGLLLVVLLPWIGGRSSLDQVSAGLSTIFTMASIVTMLLAIRAGEPAGKGSLNRWDEAIAFNALALLAHILRPLGH